MRGGSGIRDRLEGTKSEGREHGQHTWSSGSLCSLCSHRVPLSGWRARAQKSSPELRVPMLNHQSHRPEYQRINRNQEAKHLSNKNKLGNQPLDLQLPQSQLPTGQHENTINNRQGNMLPPKPSQPTTESPKYSNSAETQENDLKTNFMKMKEVSKEVIDLF